MLKPDLVLAMGGKVGDAFGDDTRVVQVRHSSPLVTNSLRGVGQGLDGGPSSPGFTVDPDALVTRWVEQLTGLRFRVGKPEEETVEVGAEALRGALREDWLYYLLAERQLQDT